MRRDWNTIIPEFFLGALIISVACGLAIAAIMIGYRVWALFTAVEASPFAVWFSTGTYLGTGLIIFSGGIAMSWVVGTVFRKALDNGPKM